MNKDGKHFNSFVWQQITRRVDKINSQNWFKYEKPINKSNFIANKRGSIHDYIWGCCFESNKYLWYSQKKIRFPIWERFAFYPLFFVVLTRWEAQKSRIKYCFLVEIKSRERIKKNDRGTQSVIKYHCVWLNELNVLCAVVRPSIANDRYISSVSFSSRSLTISTAYHLDSFLFELVIHTIVCQ